MSIEDDIGRDLAAALRERDAKLERVAKLAGWGKAIVSAALSAAISIASAGWWFRGLIDDLRKDIELTRADVHYLREHIDGVEKVAIEAKSKGEAAQQLVWAQKGGYPQGVRQP